MISDQQQEFMQWLNDELEEAEFPVPDLASMLLTTLANALIEDLGLEAGREALLRLTNRVAEEMWMAGDPPDFLN